MAGQSQSGRSVAGRDEKSGHASLGHDGNVLSTGEGESVALGLGLQGEVLLLLLSDEFVDSFGHCVEICSCQID
jgi:hypothetical protein